MASAALMLARGTVIRHVTSKPLGSLAPGYAATRGGYLVYAGLVADVGLAVLGVAFGSAPLLIFSAGLFIGGSISVLAGEAAVYRAHRRRRD